MGDLVGVQEVQAPGDVAQDVCALPIPPQPAFAVVAQGLFQISPCNVNGTLKTWWCH